MTIRIKPYWDTGGISGYSGLSGLSGISGYSGLSGLSGISGYSDINNYLFVESGNLSLRNITQDKNLNLQVNMGGVNTSALTVKGDVSNVGINTILPQSKLHVATILTTSPRGIISAQHSSSTDDARLHLRKSRGTETSPTIITTGDSLGGIVVSGYDGANYLEMGSVEIASEKTVALTRVPTKITFKTGTDATPSVLTERMAIDSSGNMKLNGATVGTGGAGVISIPSGTAPVTSPASTVQLWAQNYSGLNTSRLYMRTETDKVDALALLSETGISYGVAWNESTDSYTRLGTLSNYAVGTTLAASLLPIQALMRRCIVNDAGVVVYYLYPTDSTLKVDGVTPSNLDGTDGQVMVEIPKFWYKYNYVGTTHYWEISPVAKSGFTVHPAFIKNGVEVNNRYIGAYEGVLYDTSVSLYVDGIYQTAWSCTFANGDSSITANTRTAPFKYLTVGQKITVSGTVSNNGTFTVASLVSNTKIAVSEALVNETAGNTVITTQKDYTVTTGDKLSSVSGKTPINYLTRANARVIASNRGTGWRQLDYSLSSAIELLYLTEYASFYSQSMIGVGITNANDWLAYNDYNPIVRSGNSNAIGNATGNTGGSTSSTTETTKYLSYRGIENWFGHVWKWIDGININNNIPYITNNSTNWYDDTITNYTRPNNILGTAVTMINANGYQNTLLSISEGFLPLSVGASSSTKITDYYYQTAGFRVARFGGNAADGATAGGFYWSLADVSGYLYRSIGARVSF